MREIIVRGKFKRKYPKKITKFVIILGFINRKLVDQANLFFFWVSFFLSSIYISVPEKTHITL